MCFTMLFLRTPLESNLLSLNADVHTHPCTQAGGGGTPCSAPAHTHTQGANNLHLPARREKPPYPIKGQSPNGNLAREMQAWLQISMVLYPTGTGPPWAFVGKNPTQPSRSGPSPKFLSQVHARMVCEGGWSWPKRPTWTMTPPEAEAEAEAEHALQRRRARTCALQTFGD